MWVTYVCFFLLISRPKPHFIPATAVLMSVTGSAPFNGAADQTLAVAYISAFILIFVVCLLARLIKCSLNNPKFSLFPLGGHYAIARDFNGPDLEWEEVRATMKLKRKVMLSGGLSFITQRTRHPSSDKRDPEKGVQPEPDHAPAVEPTTIFPAALHKTSGASHKHVSFFDETESTTANAPFSPSTSRAPTEIGMMSQFTSPTPTIAEQDSAPPTRPGSPHTETTLHQAGTENRNNLSPSPSKLTARRLWLLRFKMFLASVMMPSSFAILISFPIAIISPLKALFVHVPGTTIPDAPDGQPPLAFIMDAAQFIGL